MQITNLALNWMYLIGLMDPNHGSKIIGSKKNIRFDLYANNKKADDRNSNLIIYLSSILQQFLRTNFIFQVNKSIRMNELTCTTSPIIWSNQLNSTQKTMGHWCGSHDFEQNSMSRLRIINNKWLNVVQRGKIQRWAKTQNTKPKHRYDCCFSWIDSQSIEV